MNSKKLTHLEGMRALMAINVVLCHFVGTYYPQMCFESSKNDVLSLFYTTPLSVLINGNVAVVFFFALTGFLVGMSVFQKNSGGNIIWNKTKNRYLRLLPTIAISTLFTFLTMVLGLQFHMRINNVNVNLEYLHSYCNFEPSILSLLANMFYLPFVEYNAYIGPFWTISYEFLGYIIVLVAAIVLKESKIRRFIYLLIMLIMQMYLNTNYVIFIMGLFVADLHFNQNKTLFSKFYSKLINNKVLSFICLIISTYFACCPMHENSPIYSFWFKFPLVNNVLLRGFGMALFIFASMNLKSIQRLLSLKPLVFLGEMSFETYAMHWPIMLSLEAGLFLVFEKHLSYNYAALLAFIISVPVIYVSSYLLKILVKQCNKWIELLGNKITNR